MFFGAAGLPLHIGMRGRVPATRALLMDVNERENALEQLRPIFEQVADPREYIQTPERLDAVVEHLHARLRTDGYELRRIDERYRLVELGMNAPIANALAETARLLNLDSVSRDFERAIQQAD